MDKHQDGEGLFMRDPGKFPPTDRALIEKVGNEKVTKLTLYQYPISISSFAKFVGALKNTPYDSLIHIGVVINGKYMTEKDAVLSFKSAGVPAKSTKTLDIPVNKDLTISEMLENTRKRMGDERFSTYKALSWNCQDYLKNLLDANGLSSSTTTDFILQDLTGVIKNLPSYTDLLSNAFTGAKAVVNRIMEGEGEEEDLPINSSRALINSQYTPTLLRF